jgi:hypothetical protein
LNYKFKNAFVALLLMLAGAISLHGQTKTVFSNVQRMDRWHQCSGCANAGGGAITSMTPGVKTPSLSGSAAKFFLGGTKPWSHALYYRWMSSNNKATNFIYDINYYYLNSASNSSGMEFSASQRIGYKWYRFDTQCSFLLGAWQLWDNANGHWVKTSIPCNRPSAYKWNHLVIEGKRVNGRVLFVSISLNGNKHYLNKSFAPKSMGSSSSAVNIHFQLNGDRYQHDYSVVGDKFTLTYW